MMRGLPCCADGRSSRKRMTTACSVATRCRGEALSPLQWESGWRRAEGRVERVLGSAQKPSKWGASAGGTVRVRGGGRGGISQAAARGTLLSPPSGATGSRSTGVCIARTRTGVGNQPSLTLGVESGRWAAGRSSPSATAIMAPRQARRLCLPRGGNFLQRRLVPIPRLRAGRRHDMLARASSQHGVLGAQAAEQSSKNMVRGLIAFRIHSGAGQRFRNVSHAPNAKRPCSGNSAQAGNWGRRHGGASIL